MYYLTGSETSRKYKSVFDLLCDSSQNVLLLHDDKIIKADELFKYCGKNAEARALCILKYLIVPLDMIYI